MSDKVGLVELAAGGSLLLDERITREVDQQALAEYLQYGYIPSPRTILKCSSLCATTVSTWCRWLTSPRPAGATSPYSFEAAATVPAVRS